MLSSKTNWLCLFVEVDDKPPIDVLLLLAVCERDRVLGDDNTVSQAKIVDGYFRIQIRYGISYHATLFLIFIAWS